MIKKLKLKGHIIDSLILSKLLDKITELGVYCHTLEVKVAPKREDMSEAIFEIETEDTGKLDTAVAFAVKHGATEL